MTERQAELASIDSLYSAKNIRYPQDASPSRSNPTGIRPEAGADQILIEVNREFNEEAKFTVKRIQNAGNRNYSLLEKQLATAESANSDPHHLVKDKNPEIFCIDNGVNSSESKGDCEEDSTSQRIQVLFIGGQEHEKSMRSIQAEQYESD